MGVIGHTGRGNYGHGLDTMWLGLPNIRLVGVADPDAKGRASAQQRLGSIPGYSDYRELLERERPNIVSIAPRHVDQHYAMCLAAIDAGAQGIYIEKPFCRTPEEADEIVVACEKRQVKLAIAHRNRYHPLLHRVAGMLAQKEIGEVVEVRGRGKEDQRGGCEDLWVLGSHVMNLVEALFGMPKSCSAEIYQEDRPCSDQDIREGNEGIGPIAGNRLHARFELASGIPFYFDSIRGRGGNEAGFGMRISGTRGMIDFRIDQLPFAKIWRGNPQVPSDQAIAWETIQLNEDASPASLDEIHKKVASHFYAGEDLLAAIKNNTKPLCDEVAGRATVEMICAVMASHRLHGARVALPLKERTHPFRFA